MQTNFIKGDNPFNLAGPPAWWLAKLKDFDDSLVVMPSKMNHLYRLCQRRPPEPRANIVHSLSTDSDAKQMAQFGLIPVTTIISTAKWDNPLIWEDLRQRSPHRMGGAEKFEQALLTRERKKELDVAKEIDERNTDVAKDAWNYYLLKAGRKNQLYSPRVKDRSSARKPTLAGKIYVPGS